MALVRILHAAEPGFDWFQFYDPRMGRGCYGVLVPLSSGVYPGIDQYRCEYFVVRSAFDSTSAYLAFCR